MPEEPSLSPHPYQHDAWFMLGYLRMCIQKTGAISTTDWLEALKASRISQAEERETRQVAEELNLPTPTFILEEPLRPTPTMREAMKEDLAKVRHILEGGDNA